MSRSVLVSDELMRLLFLFFILFLGSKLALAEEAVVSTEDSGLKVYITEISPHKVGNESEWFEFMIEYEGDLDLSNWSVGNDSENVKLFSDLPKIRFGHNVRFLEENVFAIDGSGYFYWETSPISLPNDGGIIQLYDSNKNLLASVNYPITKSGKKKDYNWGEILNYDLGENLWFPLLYWDNQSDWYKHTQGRKNEALIALPKSTEILINEVSPNHAESDFLELKVVSPKKVNLKYASIKHNGTKLYTFETDTWVKAQDLILVTFGEDLGVVSQEPLTVVTDKKSGLSGGSGTIEIVLAMGTSKEARADVLCYQKAQLSQTEQKRVDKFIHSGDWQGDCVSIDAIIKNESLARALNGTDTNQLSDWQRHFNGSFGHENELSNQFPKAVITMQGNRKVFSPVPFSVNLTGEDSFDPDGDFDLATFHWTQNGSLWSEKANPSALKITEPGEYMFELTVSDHSGATDTTALTVVATEKESLGASFSGNRTRTRLQVELEQSTLDAKKTSSVSSSVTKNYFAKVLQNPQYMEALHRLYVQAYTKYPDYNDHVSVQTGKEIVVFEDDWKRRIQLPKPVRTKARKNLGVIYHWNEVPWDEQTTAAFSAAKVSQNAAYFSAVFLELSLVKGSQRPRAGQ